MIVGFDCRSRNRRSSAAARGASFRWVELSALPSVLASWRFVLGRQTLESFLFFTRVQAVHTRAYGLSYVLWSYNGTCASVCRLAPVCRGAARKVPREPGRANAEPMAASLSLCQCRSWRGSCRTVIMGLGDGALPTPRGPPAMPMGLVA